MTENVEPSPEPPHSVQVVAYTVDTEQKTGTNAKVFDEREAANEFVSTLQDREDVVSFARKHVLFPDDLQDIE